MESSEIGAFIGGLLVAALIMFLAMFGAVVEPQDQELDRLRFQLAQPDPHAVEVIRTKDGELIALPKDANLPRTKGDEDAR